MDQTRLDTLEKRIADLEANKIAVIMSVNADTNLYRSLQRTLSGNVHLGIGTSSPATNTILDVVSTSLGFRPPCMTTIQRDAIAVDTMSEGILIYNTTTHALNFYTGSAWAAV